MFFSIVENSGNKRSVIRDNVAVNKLLQFKKQLVRHRGRVMPKELMRRPSIIVSSRSVLNKHGLAEIVPAKDKECAVTKHYIGGKVGVTSGDVW